MTKFKWLFALIFVALFAGLILAYGWGAGILGFFAATYFAAFLLVERDEEDEGDVDDR